MRVPCVLLAVGVPAGSPEPGGSAAGRAVVPARVRHCVSWAGITPCPWHRGPVGWAGFPGCCLQHTLAELSPECVAQGSCGQEDTARAEVTTAVRSPLQTLPREQQVVPCSCCPSSLLNLRYAQE